MAIRRSQHNASTRNAPHQVAVGLICAKPVSADKNAWGYRHVIQTRTYVYVVDILASSCKWCFEKGNLQLEEQLTQLRHIARTTTKVERQGVRDLNIELSIL